MSRTARLRALGWLAALLATAAPGARADTALAACAEITRPGTYRLTADLAASAGATRACLDIHDAADVRIDCAGHAIAAPGFWTGHGAQAVRIRRATRFGLRGCHIAAPDQAVLIEDSAEGSVRDNVVGAELGDRAVYVNAFRTRGLLVEANRFVAMWGQAQAAGNTLSGNHFACPFTRGPGLCWALIMSSEGGSGNRYLGNDLDGRSTVADSARDGGTDDGILLTDEDRALVAGNRIRNVGDAGVENVGDLTDSVIQGNVVDGICDSGFGGWFYSSLRGNVLRDNVVRRCRRLLNYSRHFGLRPARDGRPADREVAFAGNLFERNRLEPSARSVGRAPLHLPIYAALGAGTAPVVNGRPGRSKAFGLPGHHPVYDGAETPPTLFVLQGNEFRDNDFGDSAKALDFGLGRAGARFLPGAILDGGGNRCAGPGFPLACGR